eukprot:COSAG01_NODE_33589_length_561_cov_6.816017_1_plen_94_part_00
MFPPWGFCLTPIPSCCSRGVRIPPHSGRVDSCVRSVCLTRSGSVIPGVPSNPEHQQQQQQAARTVPTPLAMEQAGAAAAGTAAANYHDGQARC